MHIEVTAVLEYFDGHIKIIDFKCETDQVWIT